MTAPRITLTDEERQILIDMRAEGKTQHQVADRVGVDILIIRREMVALGLPTKLTRPWSPDEEAKLRSVVWPITAFALLEMFPGRTKSAIIQRCNRDGIKLSLIGNPPWTDDENAIVTRLFGTAPVGEWQHLLPNRTAAAINNHARWLGLRSGLHRAYLFTEVQTFKRHRKSKRRSVIRTTSHTDSSPAVPG